MSSSIADTERERGSNEAAKSHVQVAAKQALKRIEDKRPSDLYQNSYHVYYPSLLSPNNRYENPTTTTTSTFTTASLIPLHPLNGTVHAENNGYSSKSSYGTVQRDSGARSTNSSQNISSYVHHSTRLLLETHFSSDSVRISEWLSSAETTRLSSTTKSPHALNCPQQQQRPFHHLPHTRCLPRSLPLPTQRRLFCKTYQLDQQPTCQDRTTD